MFFRSWIGGLVVLGFAGVVSMAQQPERREMAPQTGHAAGVTAVAFRPGADQVLTASNDGSAILWDAKTGRQLRQYRTGPLPTALLAKLELAMEKAPTTFPYGMIERPSVSYIQFGPDGKWFAMIGMADSLFGSFSADPLAMIYETETGKLLRSFAIPLGTGVASLSHDGKSLLVNTYSIAPEDVAEAAQFGIKLETQSGALFYDVATGEFARDAAEFQNLDFSAVDCSSDGRCTLAVGRDIRGGEQPNQPLDQASPPADPNEITPPAPSPDENAAPPDPSGAPPMPEQPKDILKIWENASGKELAAIPVRSGVLKANFSPSADAVLTLTNDGVAEVWSVAEKKLLFDRPAVAAAFTPDGKQVLMVDKSGELIFYAFPDGKELRRLDVPCCDVKDLALSADGSRILIGITRKPPENNDNQPAEKPFLPGEAVLIDASDGKILQTFAAKSTPVDFVAIDPQGTRFLTGDVLWDPAAGQKQAHLCEKSMEAFSALFIAGSRQALVANHPKSAFLSGLFDGWFGAPRGVCVARVVEIPSLRQIAQFDAAAQIRDRVVLGASPDSKKAFTLTATNSEFAVWDVATGKNIARNSSNNLLVHGAAFALKHPWAVANIERQDVLWWDRKTGKRTSPDGRTKQDVGPQGPAMPPNGENLEIIVADDRASLAVQPPGKPDQAQTLPIDDPRDISVKFTGFDAKNQQFVFADVSHHRIELWDVAAGKKLREFPLELPFVTKQFCFSPDDRRVTAAGDDGRLTTWDSENGKMLAQAQLDSPLVCAVYSPDAKTLAVGCADHSIVLTTPDGASKKVLQGHEGRVDALAFHPDGRLLLSASQTDGTARIWDLNALKELAKIILLNDRQDWLIVTPDGRFDGSDKGCRQAAFRIGDTLDVQLAEQFSAEGYQPTKGLLKSVWK